MFIYYTKAKCLSAMPQIRQNLLINSAVYVPPALRQTSRAYGQNRSPIGQYIVMKWRLAGKVIRL